LQRDSRRVENLGTRLALAIFDLLAIGCPVVNCDTSLPAAG
jgi:hypothetical protein